MNTTSKNKEKRPRSSSESNKSFVNNVTSRVSGLLPSTITMWLNSSSLSDTNGSAQVVDATDSSTEDEAPENLVEVQPTAKRMRNTSPGNLNQFNQVESFVKNVTSRVTGLLPYTISKWLSSPSLSDTNGSAQVADATDSSTEDEAPESLVELQPPAKRMRYTSAGNLNQFNQVETRCTSTNTETIDDAYNINPLAKERINSSNEPVDMSAQDSLFKSQHSLSSLGHSMATKRKLFNNSSHIYYSRPSSTHVGNIQEPYFKPSLLSSSFYVGMTRYGGASSSYINQPNNKGRNISLTNDTVNSNSVNMSQSSRRVMDLLENYSSPLVEAKRIRQAQRNVLKVSINNSSYLNSNQYRSKINNSYKTQELYVPSIASILSIKRKSRLMDTTNAARQIIASHSSSSEFQPNPINNFEGNSQKGDKFTTKVKSRITRANREQYTIADNDSVDNVILPNVVLQIDKDNLPKFSFSPSHSSLKSSNTSIQTPVIITPDQLKRSIEIDQLASKENHASIKNTAVQVDEKKDLQSSSSVTTASESNNVVSPPHKFSFGSPERNIENIQDLENKDNLNNQTEIENKLPPPLPQKSTWKCLDCWVLNKTDVDSCVCCGGKKPVELENDIKKCSLCNVFDCQPLSEMCAECTEKSTNINNPFVTKGINSLTWKCDDCWVDNEESNDKCVCCGAKSPKNTALAPVSFEKKIEDKWICNDCWIENKSTLNNCAACSATKPGSKMNSSINPSLPNITEKAATTQDEGIINNTLESIAKSQREKWECPLCLVRNESNRVTCICCEADKPGTINESHKKSFNFHQPSEITFKFGIQHKNQELLKTQDNIDTEEENMAEEPSSNETNNNVLPKIPTFNFGSMPFKNMNEQAGTQSVDVPKVNFKFGVQKTDPAPPVPETTNTLTEHKVEVVEEKKIQEVPQVFPKPPSGGFLKVSTNLFKIPVPSQNAQEVVAPILTQPSTDSTAMSFFNTPVTSTTNSDVNPQHNSFTFPSIRPATNLFAATTTATTSITAPLTLSTPGTSTMSIFHKADATTTTVSFFQTNDSKTSTAMSLFPEAESMASTTSVTASVTAPMFSFGTLGQLPQVQDQPKFQFNFGINNTETPLFNPTFGVSNDNNAQGNVFNISSNSITSGNGLTGNPVNNTTPVNTVNSLTDNSLATAPTPGLFGSPMQNEWKIWPANNNVLFPTSSTTNTVQNAPTFAFGTTIPFNSNSAAFGTTTQPAQNVFGIPATASQPMFGNQLNIQTTPNIFGSTQPPSNPMPMGMFDTMPNAGGTPAFGTPNPPMSTFETQSLTSAPAPAFSFGGQQPPSIFGFGQAQPNPAPQVEAQPPQPPQPAMYNFAPAGSAPQQLQFNMGSAPNTGRRIIRKALRRSQR